MAFNNDGSLLASGDERFDIIVWNMASSQMIRKFSAHKQILLTLAFSKCGGILVTGACDNSLKIWDVQTLRNIKNL